MGLDITLARIVNHEINEGDWLEAKECPELEPLFHENIRTKHFEADEETASFDVEVYFYEELAHQRKGVTDEFIHEFDGTKCITQRSDVEKMIQFIDQGHKISFEIEFINQFEAGKDIIIVSW